ncbi:MAG: glycoside hydrolase family 5 protein [Chlorobi bacterium]|nr:glycoside hydrolase family 5 protein [Chlorobiota bacterium]
MQSPGSKIVNDSTKWGKLESYVKDIIKSFKADNRILLWDLYNEPGNTGQLNKSLPLLKAVFRLTREVGPSQPVSVSVWNYSTKFDSLNNFSLNNSDVITFHQYSKLDDVKKVVKDLRKYNRPLMCTEYMARTNNSKFATHLPYFKKENISAINWGLVSGKTQTIYPWGSKQGSPEPEVWFHDIFRSDGTPFDKREVKLIKEVTGKR